MKISLVISLLILLGFASLTEAQESRDFSGTIESDGLTRTFTGHLPPSFDQSSSFALVLALHGGGGDAKGMAALTDFNRVADREGFIVVYPEGNTNNWNDGRLAERDIARVDDVRFISELIDLFVARFKADPTRVYATGISNGGFMVQRLACELSTKVAAVATVAATFPRNLDIPCNPQRFIPVMFIQGTDDKFVPIEGGEVIGGRGKILSLQEAITKWVNFNQCQTLTSIAETDIREDGTRTTRQQHTDCTTGNRIVGFIVEKGGHTWPGGLQYLPVSVIGLTSRDFNASELIWTFFSGRAFELQQPLVTIDSVDYNRPTLTINGVNFTGSVVKVTINGQDVSSRIKSRTANSLTLNGNRLRLNLQNRENQIRVIVDAKLSNIITLNF
ncbi:MAG: hypothetical protein JNN15_11855 [Blastocatellia bacterium]|nr:hypothetical protein [Blastocatellia bacterium]